MRYSPDRPLPPLTPSATPPFSLLRMQTQHKAFELPRPLLRRVADALWAEHGEASLFELNLAAARAADFLSTRAADLARSILDAGRQQGRACSDALRRSTGRSAGINVPAALPASPTLPRGPPPAVIHACADHVRRDPKQAAHMRQAINVGHHASRKPRVQGELGAWGQSLAHHWRHHPSTCKHPPASQPTHHAAFSVHGMQRSRHAAFTPPSPCLQESWCCCVLPPPPPSAHWSRQSR